MLILVVTRGYFRAMRMPVLSGRYFGERDRHGTPAGIVVNRALAERFFPGEDPIAADAGVCGRLLAVIGLYGVASYSVSQRTRQIGIRMVVGAGRGEVAGMVMREPLLLAAAGLTLGLAGAVALTRVMHSLPYEITPTDPLTLAGISLLVAALVAAVVMIGSFLPARRAASVNPVVALRYE
jgi:putative ABC transport system permease protein